MNPMHVAYVRQESDTTTFIETAESRGYRVIGGLALTLRRLGWEVLDD